MRAERGGRLRASDSEGWTLLWSSRRESHARARQEVGCHEQSGGSEARSFHQTSALKPASSPSRFSSRRLKWSLLRERRRLSMDLITFYEDGVRLSYQLSCYAHKDWP